MLFKTGIELFWTPVSEKVCVEQTGRKEVVCNRFWKQKEEESEGWRREIFEGREDNKEEREGYGGEWGRGWGGLKEYEETKKRRRRLSRKKLTIPRKERLI